MADEIKLPEWHNPGIEPPERIKRSGWGPGEKPAAQYMNWQMNQTYESLVHFRDSQQQMESSFSQQLAQTSQQVAHSIKSVPQPIPTTIKSNTAKLVIVSDTNDKINVLQSNGTNYVLYELDAAAGTSTQSVGQNWDLIRLKKALLVNDVYVAKSQYDEASVVGTIDTLYAPAYRNTFDTYSVYTHSDEATAQFISSSGDGFGLAVRGLSNVSTVSEVSFKLNVGTNGKANIVLFGTATSTTQAEILVNGEVVKTIDTTKFALGNNLTFKTIDIDIPSRLNFTSTVTVTIRNKDLTGKKLYFVCANFYRLKEYDGQDVDFYKAFTTSNAWINHAGASDYAIFDHDLQQWCGSYHGGETRLTARLVWSALPAWNPTAQYQIKRVNLRNKTDVPAGWYILPSFKLQQLTDINGKGKMLSMLDFDTDGTLQMSFGFSEGTINIESFYTALATTHIAFNHLRYPTYQELPPAPTNVFFANNEGHVIQHNSIKNLSLGHRYTLFENSHIPDKRKTSGWIYNHATQYKKMYYGYADGFTDGVLVNSLQFKKALDFMSE